MDVVLIQIISFIAAFLLVLAVPSALRKRNPDTASFEGSSLPSFFRLFHREMQVLGQAFSGFFIRALPVFYTKRKQDLPLESLIGAQMFFALAFFGFVFFIAFLGTTAIAKSFVWAVIGMFLGWTYPTTWLSSFAQKRQRAISNGLPYALDLLTVAMQAGQDFGAALRFLVQEGPKGPLRDEFGQFLRETDLGKTRAEALRSLADRINLEELRSLVSSVIQSIEMGASLTETLRIQAEEIRNARFYRAEEKAARAPSIMLVPMMLFILPAVFIVIFTPIVIRILTSTGKL